MKSVSEWDTSQYDTLNNELNAINTFVDNFIDKHDISFQEVFNLLNKKREKRSTLSGIRRRTSIFQI